MCKSIKLHQSVGHCEAVTINDDIYSYPDDKIPDHLSSLLPESCVNLDENQLEMLNEFLIKYSDVFTSTRSNRSNER